MSLKLINKLEKSQKINQFFIHRFAIERDSVYLIEITASAKSHQQNHQKNKFQDDELTAQIDNHIFDQKPAIWNGNSLKNLQKTVAFIIYLEKGNHTVNLIPQQHPYLQQINIFEVENSKISYQPTTNNPAQEGDCRPWYSYMIVNLGLKKISFQAKAKKQFFSFDDDDLQLKIDDKIIKNNDSKVPYWHRDWYWCGKVLKGKSKDFFQASNLTEGMRFIELNADRTPLLEKVVLEITQESKPGPVPTVKIQPYNKIDQNDYNRYDGKILEAVDEWNNFFSKQQYPPEILLDPNLVKAIIYIESRMGYGIGSNQAYPDVMQVADEENPAIHTLNNDGWIDPHTGKIAKESEFVSQQEFKILDYNSEANGKTSQQSIYWGVRWLYHKAQKFYGTGPKSNLDPPLVREWKTWEQAVLDYNDSLRKVEYQKEVWQLYEKGIDPDGRQLW